MKKIVYFIGAALLAAACSKSEIDTWDAKPCVWFTTENDTVLFSFYSQPTANEYTLEFPITMAGAMADVDREIAIKDLGGSPENPGTRYEVVSAKIPAGEVTGTLQVKVHRTDNLKAKRDTIGFEIMASDLFEIGLESNLRCAAVLSDFLSKPAWWTSDAHYKLGYYSDKKLEIIYMVLGSDEMFAKLSSWWGDDIDVAVYRLNQYCKKNNIKYDPSDTDYIHFERYSK